MNIITYYKNLALNVRNIFSNQVTNDLKELKDFAGSIPWFIVLGGDQNELREVFKFKNLEKYFNGGIYGSPMKKVDILKSKIEKKSIKFPALFLVIVN